MARPHVLSVGQCGFDHSLLSGHLKRAFEAQVTGADTTADALKRLRKETFDLVLVNRIGDRDGLPGLELIRILKGDPDLNTVPVMLVSDYPDAQAEAVALGALPGFGKSNLRDRETLAKLDFLNSSRA